MSGAAKYDPLFDRGGYRDGDRVGETGIEASQENQLRGLRGLQTSRLDNGETGFLPPVRGKDVALTLDIMLQARVQAATSPALGLAVVQEWQRTPGLELPVGAPTMGMPLNGRGRGDGHRHRRRPGDGVDAQLHARAGQGPPRVGLQRPAQCALPQPRHRQALPARLDRQATHPQRRCATRQLHTRPAHRLHRISFPRPAPHVPLLDLQAASDDAQCALRPRPLRFRRHHGFLQHLLLHDGQAARRRRHHRHLPRVRRRRPVQPGRRPGVRRQPRQDQRRGRPQTPRRDPDGYRAGPRLLDAPPCARPPTRPSHAAASR